MKKILTLLFCTFLLHVNAQEKLKIEYEFRNVFDIENASDARSKETYRNSNEKRLYFELITSQTESTFNKIDRVDNSQNRSGMSISFVSGPGGFYYKNLTEKYSLSELNYNGKNLLILDSLKQQNWKLEREKSKILGFDVKKAVLQESDNKTIEVWYASKLNFKNGPSNYEGLPGVILKLVATNKANNQINKQIYLATKVELSDKFKVVKPTKGKQINQTEFDQMVEVDNKKFNEMFLQK